MAKPDERYSQNGAKYFTLDFDNITERGLKKLIDEFAKQKQKTAAVEATNRVIRKDGLATKVAVMRFENGQSIRITVGDQGDIIETRLNASTLPVRDMATMASYAKEVSAKLVANQPRFDKSLLRKTSKVTDSSGKKPAGRTIQARIIEAKSANVAAQTNVGMAKNRIAEAQGGIATSQSSLAAILQALEAERQVKNDLITQIEQKGGSIE